MEKLERKINSYRRRWLGVPRNFCSIGLYSTGSKLQMPVTSVVKEYKATKTSHAMMLRDSKHCRVRQAGIEVRTGRKWSANRALKEAEEHLHHADIVGAVAQSRFGLDCTARASWKKANSMERRSMLQKEVRKTEEESGNVKAVAMTKQGSWSDTGSSS
ncbi:PREDICTED: uncharacterized protein LOC107717409 [Scomber scombrus]|uniref:PREDICTED: uncharacterized protein LOC107717409 n=1 Tax=Scomber scombrus TaxID=13677 RepID=A0AAV1Q9P0_SCOSC